MKVGKECKTWLKENVLIFLIGHILHWRLSCDADIQKVTVRKILNYKNAHIHFLHLLVRYLIFFLQRKLPIHMLSLSHKRTAYQFFVC